MEEKLGAGLAERQIAKLVDHDQVVAQEGLDQAAATSGGFLLFELVGQTPGQDQRRMAEARNQLL